MFHFSWEETNQAIYGKCLFGARFESYIRMKVLNLFHLMTRKILPFSRQEIFYTINKYTEESYQGLRLRLVAMIICSLSLSVWHRNNVLPFNILPGR